MIRFLGHWDSTHSKARLQETAFGGTYEVAMDVIISQWKRAKSPELICITEGIVFWRKVQFMVIVTYKQIMLPIQHERRHFP